MEDVEDSRVAGSASDNQEDEAAGRLASSGSLSLAVISASGLKALSFASFAGNWSEVWYFCEVYQTCVTKLAIPLGWSIVHM